MKALTFALALLVCSLAQAQSGTPAPGSYVIHEGAFGSLEVKAGNRFAISTVGANFHTCGLEGQIVAGKAKMKDSDCVVSFKTEGADVRVEAKADGSCQAFCGQRAGFEGLYLRPPAQCLKPAMAQARTAFKKRYDTKDYPGALAALQPVVAQCRDFLYWTDFNRLQNDLAITQYHLGDKTGCLATLKDFAEDAAKTDDQIREDYPPSNADDYLAVVKAARTNLKKCKE
jgi:hypothetical protein